ncbi:MAG TPA: serine/threonine-protein kinase, partial [Ktedonobacteraceae bacterium]|nr:serine/threonine-protein kinase [Ktedonobacteraceae bacterium]
MNDRVGQLLGNYRLNSLIGQGGSGEVYLAEHIHLNTLVSIKILSMQLASDETEGFKKEAQIIAHLVHPNIIRVLDYDIDNNLPYLVMDYAPNGNLRSRHPFGTRLPADIIVSYVKQMASALQFAHEQDVVHRDVKPENMLIGRNDEILLSDFGIALVGSSMNSRPPQNFTGTFYITGTPLYMAPEQITGNPGHASDQYGLGVIVYEWLCGSPPFHGSFMALAMQHMVTPPTPLREKVPSISPDIEQVVLRALAKDAQDRFATIQEFADALEQAVLQSEVSEDTLAFKRSASEPVKTVDENDLNRTDPGYSNVPPAFLEDDT